MYRVCSVRTTRERPVRPTPSFIYERRDAVTFLRAEVAIYRLLPMLVTARPEPLPIDLKRQGRAEVHIPLFYPTDESEIRQMFTILAKKMGSKVAS